MLLKYDIMMTWFSIDHWEVRGQNQPQRENRSLELALITQTKTHTHAHTHRNTNLRGISCQTAFWKWVRKWEPTKMSSLLKFSAQNCPHKEEIWRTLSHTHTHTLTHTLTHTHTHTHTQVTLVLHLYLLDFFALFAPLHNRSCLLNQRGAAVSLSLSPPPLLSPSLSLSLLGRRRTVWGAGGAGWGSPAAWAFVMGRLYSAVSFFLEDERTSASATHRCHKPLEQLCDRDTKSKVSRFYLNNEVDFILFLNSLGSRQWCSGIMHMSTALVTSTTVSVVTAAGKFRRRTLLVAFSGNFVTCCTREWFIYLSLWFFSETKVCWFFPHGVYLHWLNISGIPSHWSKWMTANSGHQQVLLKLLITALCVCLCVENVYELLNLVEVVEGL